MNESETTITCNKAEIEQKFRAGFAHLKYAEQERRMEFARQEAAKAWCSKDTSNIPMDAELAEEFAEILVVHMYAPHLGCATTGELLDEVKARVDIHYSTIQRD